MARIKNNLPEYKGWLVIPLTFHGESVLADDILKELKSVFGDAEYFIPKKTIKDRRHGEDLVLFNGYVFVRKIKHLPNLNSHRYFSPPLKSGNIYMTISEEELLDLQRKLDVMKEKDIHPGLKVKVTGGTYQNLIGEVVSMSDPETAVVIIKLFSKEILASITVGFLTIIDD
jgi:transcription antitermination factor NusG